jgi:peptidoglycan/LPS O-acetylase OafA/YrhL
MWSLPLEIQMYIVLPILFFYVHRERGLWVLLLLWMLAVAFCKGTFDAAHWQNLADSVPMFLAGIMAYLGFARWKPKLPSWFFPLFLAALLLIFMKKPSLQYGWLTTLALGLLLPLFSQIEARWLTRASHEVAKYSYGIYLGHPFALVLGIYLLRGHSLALQLPVVLLSIAVIAIAGYHWVEKPLINLGSRLAAKAEFTYEQVVEVA